MTYVRAAVIWVTCLVVGLVLAFVLLGLNLEGIASGEAPFTEDDLMAETVLGLVAGVVGLGILIPMVLRPVPEPRPWKLGVPAVALVLLSQSALAFPASVVAIVMVASRATTPWVVGVSASFFVSLIGGSLLLPTLKPFDWSLIALGAVILVVLLLIGWWRGRKRERVERLEERARIAEHEREELEERARLGERTRIARDMHDALAHRLSIISVHAGALSFRDNLSDEERQRTFDTIRTAVADASRDLREVLSVLREDGDATVTDPGKGIEGLVDEARRAGGDVNAEVDDLEWDALPTLTRATTYRVVQELLTNARKHAPGVPVDLRVARTPVAIAIGTVNRDGAQSTGVDAGVGLVGMRERVEVLGGSLEIERGSQFHVRVKVPIDS